MESSTKSNFLQFIRKNNLDSELGINEYKYSDIYSFMMEEFPCDYFKELYILLYETNSYAKLRNGYKKLNRKVDFLKSEWCPKLIVKLFRYGLLALKTKKIEAEKKQCTTVEEKFRIYERKYGDSLYDSYGGNKIYKFHLVSAFINEIIPSEIVPFLDASLREFGYDRIYRIGEAKLRLLNFNEQIDNFADELEMIKGFSTLIYKLVCNGITEFQRLILGQLFELDW